MGAPPIPTAPPTTPGPISDPRTGRLPATSTFVAVLDIVAGATLTLASLASPYVFDPWLIVSVVFVPAGIGVLMRSDIARLAARILHGLVGGLLTLVFVVAIIQLVLLGPGFAAYLLMGGVIYVGTLAVMAASITAFFVWGFFVLGRKDVRAACRRRSRANQAG